MNLYFFSSGSVDPGGEQKRMKVLVDCNLHISKLLEPPMDLNFEGDTVTLKDILGTLSKMCTFIEFLRQDGRVGHAVDGIFINQKNYLVFNTGLQTYLKDGDIVKVDVYLEGLGGG